MSLDSTYSPGFALPLPANSRQAAPRVAGPVDGFSLRRFLGLHWLPLLAIALRCGPSAAGTAAYVLLAVYALAGPRQAIVSLWLCWVFNMLNHGLFPPPGSAAFIRHAVVAAAFVSVFIHGRKSAYRNAGFLIPVTATMCVFLIVHSMVFSQQIDVSLLKALSFSMTSIGAVIAWAGLTPTERRDAEQFVFGSLAVITIVSLPLIALPVGYYRNGMGFQGVMVHPQNFGPSVAVLAVLLIAGGVTNRRITLWSVVLLAACVVSVYVSKARIGAVALAGGLVLGVGSELLRRLVVRIRLGDGMRYGRVLVATAGLGLTLMVGGPWIIPRISDFIDKGSRSESFVEAALRSRGHKLEQMLETIREHPTVGVGFGVNPSTDYFGIARDPVFGLPVMATVEKGVMPVAVIEETGIIGAIFTYPWLLVLLIRASARGVVAGSVCWSVLITNVAEACLFSPGGQGMFQIVIAMWAATVPLAATAVDQRARRGAALENARLAA
jgi:hypothetical protein